jgi:polar amino acid transport system permease protein
METLLANWTVLPKGLLVTLQVAMGSICIGTPLGVLIGIGLAYGKWPVRVPLIIYVDLLRGLPLLVTIFAIFYGPTTFGIAIPSITSVTLALGIFMASHMAEIARGALRAIPAEQMEASKTIGLSFWQSLVYVIAPQSIRQAGPPWTNLCIEIVKGTSLVSLVGVADILLSARHVMERTRDPLMFYLAVAVIYFLINFGISRFGAYLERRFTYVR